MLGRRVRVKAGPCAGETGTIALCDSNISKHYGQWTFHRDDDGADLIWVVPESGRWSADPSGGAWRLATNLDLL